MSCIYFLLVWLDLRTASTVTKLIDKTPQKSKDFLRVSMYYQKVQRPDIRALNQ